MFRISCPRSMVLKEERQEEHRLSRWDAPLATQNQTETRVLDSTGVKDIRSEFFILAINISLYIVRL